MVMVSFIGSFTLYVQHIDSFRLVILCAQLMMATEHSSPVEKIESKFSFDNIKAKWTQLNLPFVQSV